ncbi:DUF1800 domain-containing protein [Streptomyces armeniacus]|uniref:DUF1800 domain-containing protein n=1 Tax=Streptomyces armeniacus TaxID=83291 RepID=A0A345XWL8_9ACTN|nr:DUF1800 family protein [Streptomyces armeniacus]AXK36034.1 DUF1800 domain-containing protein [Streptomyces armeniacus]
MAAPELDATARVARLLQRTGFGAVSAERAEQAAAGGFDAALDAVLTDSDPGAAATPPPHFPPLPERPKKPQRGQGGEEKDDAKDESGKDDKGGKGDKGGDARSAYREAVREQREQLTVWWLDRMTASEQPWPEKRTFLWHGHWATSIAKVKSADAMLAQNETLRRDGGGDFRRLARAMVRDPALMVWLDASGNTAEAPNENLARELMELFVLGVGNYGEQDVREAARSLTGWAVNRKTEDGYTVRFRPRRHAEGAQRVLGTERDLDPKELVDLLTARPESARYLVTRWWGWLVSSEKGPSEEALDRITAAYGARRDVTAMVRAMFTDPAFADPDSVLVKQPVEYVVGSLRVLGLRPAELSGELRKFLLRTLTSLGQVPFRPPSVGGWPSGTAWLTTAAARARTAFAQRMTGEARESELLATVRKAPAKDRPDRLADALGTEWSDRTRSVLAEAAGDPRRVTAVALTTPEYLVLG